jgi:predicted component of type VI protein secretion system
VDPIVTGVRVMPLTLRVIGSRALALGGRAAHTFGPHGGRMGRGPDNDWVLPDPDRFVSSHHALITVVDGRYHLLDTSSNGTYVNGARDALGRHSVHILMDEDRLTIGGYEIAVEIGSRADTDVDAALATHPPLPVADVSIPDLGAALDLEGLLTPGGATPSGPLAPEAISAFYRAAGLAAPPADAAESVRVLSLAGLLLRELTTGLVAAARDRRTRDLEASDITTGRLDLRHDPIGQSTSVEEALALLLGSERRRLVPPVESVRTAFSALDDERRLAVDASRSAVVALLQRLDPAMIEQRFGSGDNDASAAHCWRQFRALHARLVAADGLPTTWNDDVEAALKRLSKAPQ